MISPEVAEKLSELLKAIDKSVRSIEENKVTLSETNELGIRHHTALLYHIINFTQLCKFYWSSLR